MDEPRLSELRCRYDNNGFHKVLEIEFLRMGFVGYWSSKDVMGG